LSAISGSRLRAIGLVPVALLAALPGMETDSHITGQHTQADGPALRPGLAIMSTGKGQELILTGDDAKSRNAMIPLSTGPLEWLPPYQPMKPSSEHYGAALLCLTQAIYYEAANEPPDGKRAVAQVVLNRLRHPAYPNSICAVVYQGAEAAVCQFSFTCDGSLARRPLNRQWQESRALAERALLGEQFGPVGTATHYHADYVVPKWAFTLQKLAVVGTHIFYRFPGRSGRSDAFDQRWARFENVPVAGTGLAATKAVPVATIDEFGAIQNRTGLTVRPDKTDRYAASDVGGRLDTTKEWRLSLPDPAAISRRYEETIADQTGSVAVKDIASAGDDKAGATR
jgi:hypothetical protein